MADAPPPTSPTDPLAAFPPLSEAERDRSPEFYGFVALSLTYLLFVVYLAWALLPDTALEALGVAYYPSRYVLLPLNDLTAPLTCGPAFDLASLHARG